MIEVVIKTLDGGSEICDGSKRSGGIERELAIFETCLPVRVRLPVRSARRQGGLSHHPPHHETRMSPPPIEVRGQGRGGLARLALYYRLVEHCGFSATHVAGMLGIPVGAVSLGQRRFEKLLAKDHKIRKKTDRMKGACRDKV